MRVIAGTARGRKLVAPVGATTRPTPDRVREATFNALGSLGAIDGAQVLDLFAGSGAMGIEALSRGAAHVTFVDQDRGAVRSIEANLAACGLAAGATVVATSVERYLGGTRGRRWDLALIDPPYAWDRDAWLELLDLVPVDLAVLESDRAVDPPFGWEVVRSKRYGSTHVVIAARRPV
ncbi:MAG: 16S rRNA (guanine(966)-N(2))-methyltransferase RsmD [Microthrixaceae bacterium]